TGGITNDSGNQTLTDGFSYKDVNVDLAYFDWELTDELHLIAGKMANPFFRPGGYHLIYDGDIRPEGLALKYRSGSLFSAVSAFWVEERSSGPDSMLVGLQGGYRGALGNGTTLTVGASYYDTSHAQGREPFFTPLSGQGNQLDANGNYLYGFSEIELFGELELDVAGKPLVVFADIVRNRDAAAFDQGYALGAEWGSASAPGEWSVGYVYQDLEANAVIGAFTDSDFADGTSDGSGHSILASYVFPGGWNFGLRYILGERGEAAGELRDYNRLQADISVRY
ncbi:MAG TPA: putative porin, partial [Gammaproteobacteria bacterium]|nr:putative porin [Gammaproteobacteria bacterium]